MIINDCNHLRVSSLFSARTDVYISPAKQQTPACLFPGSVKSPSPSLLGFSVLLAITGREAGGAAHDHAGCLLLSYCVTAGLACWVVDGEDSGPSGMRSTFHPYWLGVSWTTVCRGIDRDAKRSTGQLTKYPKSTCSVDRCETTRIGVVWKRNGGFVSEPRGYGAPAPRQQEVPECACVCGGVALADRRTCRSRSKTKDSTFCTTSL